MKQYRTIILASLLLTSEAAFSQEGSIYISAGLNQINDFTRGSHTTGAENATGYFSGGVGGNVAIGYDFSERISLEVEYQQQKYSQYKKTTAATSWLYGPNQVSRLFYKTKSITPKIIYRFNLSNIQGLSSYVGVGAGFYQATVNYDENINNTTDTATVNGQTLQMLGGVRYHINGSNFLELRIQNDKFTSGTASSTGVLNGSIAKSHNTIGTVLTFGGYL